MLYGGFDVNISMVDRVYQQNIIVNCWYPDYILVEGTEWWLI